jgi:hypothetical protein
VKAYPPKEKASLRELVAIATTLEGQAGINSFLQKIDTIGPDLSEGKWAKLFAICAEATKATRRNIKIYASGNGYEYDVTNHKAHVPDGATIRDKLVNRTRQIKRQEKVKHAPWRYPG